MVCWLVWAECNGNCSREMLCMWCWNASSEFRQDNLVKFGELVASQGLDNEEELGHLLHKLVKSWSRSPNESMAGQKQSPEWHWNAWHVGWAPLIFAHGVSIWAMPLLWNSRPMKSGIKASQEVKHGGVPFWQSMADELSLLMAMQVVYEA